MRLKDTLRLRFLTRLISVRIRSGINAGFRWSLATRSSFIRGTYEHEKCALLQDLIQPGGCFWDVGAHYGYIALAASRLVGEHGKVEAFEPNPRNLWYLRRHVHLNNLRHIQVHPLALADENGTLQFENRGSGTGRLSTSGGDLVHARTIDALIADGTCSPPTFLKIDVEGAEASCLRGGIETLKEHQPLCLVSTHNEAAHSESLSLLNRLGYEAASTLSAPVAWAHGLDAVPHEPGLLAWPRHFTPDPSIIGRFIET
jgi:FkbM family methyltransferase